MTDGSTRILRQDDDRELLAEDWAAYIRSFITTGIRNGGDCLQVRADGSMTLKIMSGTDKNGDPADGVANIQGYIFNLRPDSSGDSYPVTVPASHPTGARIDRLVLRLDRRIENRTIMPFVLQGDAGSNPVPPPLTRNSNIYEISLARWRLNPQAAGMSQTDIVDERFNDEVCGLMNSVLGLDSSVWQKQFDDFMARILAQEYEFLSVHEDKFNTRLNAQETLWQTQTARQETDWADQTQTQKDTFEVWFTRIGVDIQILATFNFDNLAAQATGVSYAWSTKMNDLVTETLTIESTGELIAERISDFSKRSTEGIITVTESLHKDGEIIRKSVVPYDLKNRKAAVNSWTL